MPKADYGSKYRGTQGLAAFYCPHLHMVTVALVGMSVLQVKGPGVGTRKEIRGGGAGISGPGDNNTKGART